MTMPTWSASGLDSRSRFAMKISSHLPASPRNRSAIDVRLSPGATVYVSPVATGEGEGDGLTTVLGVIRGGRAAVGTAGTTVAGRTGSSLAHPVKEAARRKVHATHQTVRMEYSAAGVGA